MSAVTPVRPLRTLPARRATPAQEAVPQRNNVPVRAPWGDRQAAGARPTQSAGPADATAYDRSGTPAMPHLHLLLRALLTLCLLAAALPGRAAVWCVGTAQQLHDALFNAQVVSDSYVIIKLRTGTYLDGAGIGHFAVTQAHSNQFIEISGGWSGANGTCQNVSFDPALTVLAGASNFPSLYFNTGSSFTGNTVYVHDLTVSNTGYSSLGNGACLSGLVSASNEAIVERVQAHDCITSTGGNAAGYFSNDGGTLTARDLVARASLGKSNGGFGFDSYNGAATYLNQISVTATQSASTSSPASGLVVQNFSNAHTYVNNSVTWGNDPDAATADLRVFGPGVYLTRVHYGRLSGTPDVNNSPGTGDPGFVAAGDPHLRADSLLIDSGVAGPLGGSGSFDADGKARTVGPVDVGAFESPLGADTIFVHGFE